MIAKLIPTRVHGVLDYLFGILYIALPLLLNWPQPAAGILMMLGAGVLLYSILTRYELGLIKVIPMPVHLAIDLLGGLLLLAAPFLGLVDESVRGWFWALGAIELVITLLTNPHPHLEELAAPPAGYVTGTTGSTAAGRSITPAATSDAGPLTPSSAGGDAYNRGVAMTGLHTGMAEGDTPIRDTGPDQDGRFDRAPGAAQPQAAANLDDGMGGGDGYARAGLTEVGITPGGQVVTTGLDPQPLPDAGQWTDANRNEIGSYGETPATREDARRIDRSRQDVNK
mgnify:CR=1 FL=1